MTWQSGLMRVTRNHVPSGAQVRILVSSETERSVGQQCYYQFYFHNSQTVSQGAGGKMDCRYTARSHSRSATCLLSEPEGETKRLHCFFPWDSFVRYTIHPTQISDFVKRMKLLRVELSEYVMVQSTRRRGHIQLSRDNEKRQTEVGRL